ncbi:adenylate/guanylate cyclase domain-containing protein [Xanthobacter dioxanivorans]|uniref:Adenylate/guanylate cyclase domain-containing protein n=1 Tax=Xanthobacter dioxanivorans TaxID=2528964 RepID=A0A974SIN6_9HYPH|nr:adenylate/guanylate cyclase domain-containing protein [Xanthobacter dioxanivorans]QRG06622.1 adenylate/guanylate cyclase domain-containing protein [Xanthobacter dioxanivorans]
MAMPAAVGSLQVRVGAAVLLAALAVWAWDGFGLRGALRETAIDAVLALAPPKPAPLLTVVDIDSDTLARYGDWPWNRAQMARLVAQVAGGEPAAVAIDILFAGPDRHSPAAAARRIAAETGRADIADLVPSLPDGDALLAVALARRPVALGAVLETVPTPDFEPLTPVLASTAPAPTELWRTAGASGPPPMLRNAAQGLGIIAIAPDGDGVVRRVPLLALAGDAPVPGLAVEAVRLAEGAGALILDGAQNVLRIGGRVVPLGTDGQLRLGPALPAAWAARTVPAHRLLSGSADAASLSGRVVLIGSSAVEVGALRRTAGNPAAPSLQIQADAAAALLAGDVAHRPGWLAQGETAGALLLGLAALAAVAALRPLGGLCAGLGAGLLWMAAAVALVLARGLLVDPLGPPVVGAVTLAVALAMGFIETEWRERRLRSRFEQHLAPAVVARIAADPSALKLRGELRVITALFTDVEGFTSMTERAQPEALVAVLDRYFDRLSEVVVAHGGMADRFVGDAMLAFFNMPLDLPDHAGRALACALALRAETEKLRREPAFAALGFGRTRIGMETGPAVVGDVGGRRKLDYTAHGMAVSMAARLEAANKDLGTSICIGPGAAALLPPGAARSIGPIAVRGRAAKLEVFIPAGDREPPGPG